ncbi:MAG TPA: hypothetical protein VGF84_19145 [Micromonosporaceae bacterium]|jgi:hypothetical protein
MTRIEPTSAEVAAVLPGDDIVPRADVVMDRAFTLPVRPEQAWPWFVQLGKGRSGWYFPRSVERFIPPRRRGIRHIDPGLQSLAVGDIIDDWGGKDGYFEVAQLDPPAALVHKSTRGHTDLSWAIVLRAADAGTRVQLRLRLAPVKHRWPAGTFGGAIDAATIAGLAAGLRERCQPDHGQLDID